MSATATSFHHHDDRLADQEAVAAILPSARAVPGVPVTIEP